MLCPVVHDALYAGISLVCTLSLIHRISGTPRLSCTVSLMHRTSFIRRVFPRAVPLTGAPRTWICTPGVLNPRGRGQSTASSRGEREELSRCGLIRTSPFFPWLRCDRCAVHSPPVRPVEHETVAVIGLGFYLWALAFKASLFGLQSRLGAKYIQFITRCSPRAYLACFWRAEKASRAPENTPFFWNSLECGNRGLMACVGQYWPFSPLHQKLLESGTG